MDPIEAEAVLDRISIPQMQQRYELATRQAVYDRLKKLGITPVKGTIDAQTELPRMDGLHKLMKSPNSSLSSLSTRKMQTSSRQVDNLSEVEMTVAVLELLTARSQLPAPSAIASLRERLELLELCATQENTLSTSELAEILGLKADSFRDKRHHSQYGYSFTRAGKHHHELAWRVIKGDGSRK